MSRCIICNFCPETDYEGGYTYQDMRYDEQEQGYICNSCSGFHPWNQLPSDLKQGEVELLDDELDESAFLEDGDFQGDHDFSGE